MGGEGCLSKVTCVIVSRVGLRLLYVGVPGLVDWDIVDESKEYCCSV